MGPVIGACLSCGGVLTADHDCMGFDSQDLTDPCEPGLPPAVGVLGQLEILGCVDTRGVVALRDRARENFEELVPTCNEVVILHVRMAGGPIFCVTLDGTTFEKAVLPQLQFPSPKKV